MGLAKRCKLPQTAGVQGEATVVTRRFITHYRLTERPPTASGPFLYLVMESDLKALSVLNLTFKYAVDTNF